MGHGRIALTFRYIGKKNNIVSSTYQIVESDACTWAAIVGAC
jgi:hypothetical protein